MFNIGKLVLNISKGSNDRQKHIEGNNKKKTSFRVTIG